MKKVFCREFKVGIVFMCLYVSFFMLQDFIGEKDTVENYIKVI